MDNFLSIETSTDSCSVALQFHQQQRQISENNAQSHARVILELINQLMLEMEADYGELKGVLVDHGPGSFTGLRIGLSVAQGIAYAHDIPVCAVPSLAALAMKSNDGMVLSALDARMQEVYYALYSKSQNNLESILPPSVATSRLAITNLNNSHVSANGLNLQVVGNAISAYPELLEILDEHKINYQVIDENAKPDALTIIQAFYALYGTHEYADALISPLELTPYYVRNNVTS